MAGTPAARASEVASLLRSSLALHESHGDDDCPVCGRVAALDSDWRQRTEHALQTLDAEASSYREAESALRRSHALLEQTIPQVPQTVIDTYRNQLEPVTQWRRLLEGDTARLSVDVTPTVAAAVTAVREIRDVVASATSADDEAWRPIATRIAEWLPSARDAQVAEFEISSTKEAEDWLNSAAGELRVERFAPIADHAKRIWSTLSLNSNVSLDDVVLAGRTTSRRVDLSVSVDGEAGVALGVMSQGELHSLALSLFLPRATQPNSPFRFVVIDDPVQAMDPAKVDGLATVLSDITKTHQVVVFTHDDRLRTALWQLDLPATVIEVTRRAGSVVELEQGMIQ